MTINMYIASLAWLCLIVGYYLRWNRRLHVPLMCTGIFVDIGLVLYLQFTRGAVQKALAFSLEYLQQLHIATSPIALVLYLPVLWLGFTLVRGKETPNTRALHIKLATTALAFRTLGFGLMFSMWKD